MGSHEQGSMREMLLGEVVTNVIHGAPCPILTVRQPQHEAEIRVGVGAM